jgi:hypothetical protein
MKNKVAVIIPMYKPSLTPEELLVLDKCYEILGKHPIYFVAPDSLEIDPLLTNKASTKIIRFADPYFKNIAGYNHLMLSSEFYQAFSLYEYILIYQLDAYIFEDDLLEWCDKGYDYIGAPWIPSQKYEQTHYKMGLHVFNFLGRLTRIKTGTHNYYQVGNGGFSLRKVDSFIKITEIEEDRISYYLSRKGARFHEDVFWGVDMVKRHKNFKVPLWKEALGFSFDVRPHLAYKYSNHKLPMGCHAWNSKAHFDFWKNHIKTHSSRHKNLVVD